MKFNNKNGMNWLFASLNNANESVGRVTVLHIIFMCILMEVIYGDLAEAGKMFRILFRNDGESEYVSPVAKEQVDKSTGVKKIHVCMGLINPAVDILKTVAATKNTILHACSDFVAFGRMIQEMTIDAAKTGQKVVIEYLERVQKFKLMSRSRGHNEFNVKAIWRLDDTSIPRQEWERSEEDGGCVDFVYPKGENRWVKFGNVSKYLVNDPFNKAGVALLQLVKKVGLWITSFKPEFSDKLITSISEKAKTDVNFHALCSMSKEYKDAYRTITGCMRKEMEEIAFSTADPDDRKAWEKVIRRRYRAIYDELANEMRRGYNILANATDVRYGTNNRVMANLYVSFHDDKGERVADNSASKFADTVMEPEFFSFMTQCMRQAGEQVAEYTKDKLRRCDFPVGAVVDFVGGEAELPMIMEDGREEVFVASAEEELEGRFIIREDKNGRKVASKEIGSLVEIPEADPTRLVFQTVATPEIAERVNDFIKETMGKEIILLNHIKDVNGKNVREPVLFGGKIVSRFRKMDSYKFKDLDKNIVNGLESVYGGKAGTVSNAVASLQEVDGKEMVVAVVVLENVHDVNPNSYGKPVPMAVKTKEAAVPAAPSGFAARVQRKAMASSKPSSEKKIVPMDLSAADEFEKIFGLTEDDANCRDYLDWIKRSNQDYLAMGLPKENLPELKYEKEFCEDWSMVSNDEWLECSYELNRSDFKACIGWRITVWLSDDAERAAAEKYYAAAGTEMQDTCVEINGEEFEVAPLAVADFIEGSVDEASFVKYAEHVIERKKTV